MTEEGRTAPEAGRNAPGHDGAAGSRSSASRTSRLERRLSALEGRQHQPEPISVLRLLNTGELHQALALVERAGVMPDGDVRHPEAFQETSPEEREALEHWRELCGEPLDHLELAEELLDRVGERRGWRSPQALEIALLLKRLEMPSESSWFVRKTAEAVVALYAEMDEHGAGRGGASLHPHVRASVRRLERLEEIDRTAPESEASPQTEPPGEVEETERAKSPPGDESSRSEAQAQERSFVEEEPRRRSWWREFFGFD